MTPFTRLTSRVTPLVRDDIDTDQIIAARYLTVTDRRGLGEGLFAAWREDPASPLNTLGGRQILLAGDNFGCGSSREHAPWALLAGGYRCVIARSFADIFEGNALRNGLLPVTLDPLDHQALATRVEAEPELELTVDLRASEITWGGARAGFEVDAFSRQCMLDGVDALGYLLARQDAIEAFERRRRGHRSEAS